LLGNAILTPKSEGPSLAFGSRQVFMGRFNFTRVRNKMSNLLRSISKNYSGIMIKYFASIYFANKKMAKSIFLYIIKGLFKREALKIFDMNILTSIVQAKDNAFKDATT
jgi:hypothetical protein